MNDSQHISTAIGHLRAVGHGHTADRLTRQHIEFAAAHLREALLVESGQSARTPGHLHKAVAGYYALDSRLFAVPQTTLDFASPASNG